MALGVLGMVKKHRKIYMYNQTRIHVDTVEKLGSYMELEVSTVMLPSQLNVDAIRELNHPEFILF